jgi:hypothetical protein
MPGDTARLAIGLWRGPGGDLRPCRSRDVSQFRHPSETLSTHVSNAQLLLRHLDHSFVPTSSQKLISCS